MIKAIFYDLLILATLNHIMLEIRSTKLALLPYIMVEALDSLFNLTLDSYFD